MRCQSYGMPPHLSFSGTLAKMRQPSSKNHIKTPFLPPEIYLAIAQYVQVKDLSNFCLASKILAHAGRSELFHTIVLRTSLRSWTALKNIHDHEQLSKFVRTLIVDVTLWRIGADVRDWHEWTRYCESKVNYYTLENIDATQAALYKELAQTRHLWEAYLSRLEEEKVFMEEVASSVIQLPNLQKVRIVRGAFHVHNCHVCRVYQDVKLPITAPLSAWRGDSFSSMHNINKLIPQGLQPSVATNVIKWRLDGLTETNFRFHYSVNTVENHSMVSLKVLDLPLLYGWAAIRPSLRFHRYLSLWHNLECLEMRSRMPVVNEETNTLPDIQLYFGPSLPAQGSPIPYQPTASLIWQRIRKLILAHFQSTPEALVSLVSRHCSTLRDLRLHAISFRKDTRSGVLTRWDWQMIFRSIGAPANLDNLNLSGLFIHEFYQDGGWDFDTGDLGIHVATWIMHGCPSSQWEDILQTRRSCQGSHDQASGEAQASGQNGVVNAGGG